MGRIHYYLKLYLGYLRIGFLRLGQYPLDTFLMVVSLVIRETATFIGILMIAGITGGIGTWNIYELCLLFALGAMIEALGQTFFDEVWGIGNLCIRKGQMDLFLVRPAPVFFQLMGQHIHLQAVISFIIAIGIMINSLIKLQIPATIGLILFLIEFLFFGTMLNTSIYLCFNSLNFWLIQADQVAVLVQTMREFAKYPLHIFPLVIRGAFTFVIPFGFIGYYPVAYLTGRAGSEIPVLLPVAALATCFLAGNIWKKGIAGYDSTGT